MKKEAIYSFFLFFIFCSILHGEEISQTTHGANSPAISGTTGNVIINYGDKKEQEEHLKFEGSWNEDKAFSLVLPNPRKVDDDSDGHGDRFEKSFFIAINGIDYRIIVTSFYQADCQGCQQDLSIFSFKKDGNFWILDNESRDSIKVGRESFNNDISNNIEVVNIGPNRFGIIFTINSWYQGETYLSKEIYCFIAGELTKVLDGNFEKFFSGTEKEEAIKEGWWFEDKIDIKFINSESNFGLFNIEATYLSSKTNKKLTVNYKFNGNVYPVLDINALDECKGGVKYVIEKGECVK